MATTPFSWEDVRIGDTLEPRTMTITEDMVQVYAAGLDQHHPWFIEGSPFGGRIAQPTLLDRDIGTRLFSAKWDSSPGSLHARQDMEFIAPLRLGETYEITAEVSGKYEKRGKRYMSIDATCADKEGQPALRGRYVRMLSLGPGVAREKRPALTTLEAAPPETGPGGPASEQWQVGQEIPPVAKLMSIQKMRIYSGPGKNIHTDEEAARRGGLSRPIAQGLMSNAYLSELLMNFFGQRWLTNGQLSVAFVATVFPGDLLLSRGVIRERQEAESGFRWSLDVWVETRSGHRVTVGTASCAT